MEKITKLKREKTVRKVLGLIALVLLLGSIIGTAFLSA